MSKALPGLLLALAPLPQSVALAEPDPQPELPGDTAAQGPESSDRTSADARASDEACPDIVVSRNPVLIVGGSDTTEGIDVEIRSHGTSAIRQKVKVDGRGVCDGSRFVIHTGTFGLVLD